MSEPISLEVNGRRAESRVEPRTHLADFLREQLHLTGTHLGCEHGVCGACTVLVDGRPVRACISFAVSCAGSKVRTVEGFGDDPLMQALREAFSAEHALQCGYCTPGMLITAYDIVRRLPGAGEARIREELSGNLCRCTGYVGIVRAISSVIRDAPAPGIPVPAPPLLGSIEVALPGPAAAREASAPVGAPGVHEVAVDVATDELWALLQDIPAVVRCLPGAELLDRPSDGEMIVKLTTAVGPMRAAFEGHATVEFEDAQKLGIIEGRGEDRRTRSSGEGRIEFRVHPHGSGSRLAVQLDYSLKGPFAQFSRGAVVDAVVEQLIARFAENLSRLARGGPIDDAGAIGGFSVAWAALVARVRGWFRS